MAASSNPDGDAIKGDRFLFGIAEGWAIGCDELQWLLLKAKVAGGKGLPWRAVSFIATDRRILERCIRDKGIVVTDDARARLDALTNFRQFNATEFHR